MIIKIYIAPVSNNPHIKEAIENKMRFTEFLAILLQDEIQRRDMKKFAVRFRKSKINGNKTLEQFDFGFNPKINQQKIKNTMITRNLDFPEWGNAFPNKLLGAATIDRLGHSAYKIVLEGSSDRTFTGTGNDKKQYVDFGDK